MNSLTREGKIIVFGLLVLIIAGALFFAWFLNPERKMREEIKNATAENEVVKTNATAALKAVADIANELSGITSGAIFNFEIVDTDGRSANFGIAQLVDDVKGERIIEEHMATFREVGSPTNNISEVDRATNKVVSMHRSVPEFAKSGNAYPAEQLEATAREFVKRVYPDFERIESPSLGLLEFDPGNKTAPGVPANHFLRWNDKQFAVPTGLSMDLPPFIQVGINSRGFIFSYDNTLQLYLNLPKEALRAICGFVEMPKTDDSSIDREKGIVKVYFTEYEPFQNRYLILPYEPETDFEECSESAKRFLRHLQEVSRP